MTHGERTLSGIAEELERRGRSLPSQFDFVGGEVEQLFDQGLRHKSGKEAKDYLTVWLSMLRPFAYATKDDSWGELEKLICIVMRNYVEAHRELIEAASLIRTADDREKVLREALVAYDKVERDCPANKRRLGEALCPTCHAGSGEGCRRTAIAAHALVEATRQALGGTNA